MQLREGRPLPQIIITNSWITELLKDVPSLEGCQKNESLVLIRELATSLRGVMVGSRAIVELDWIHYTKQVGRSGLNVVPQLYIAVGISGAIQHLVGMSSAKTIIAINKDPDAPIFKVADLGVVGDAMDTLLILLRQGKK